MSTDKDKDQSLLDMVEALIASSKAHQKAKKESLKAVNPFKETIAKDNGDGTFKFEVIDRRLASPHWETVNRVIVLRQVTCLECGQRYEAPNEQMLIRKEHPKYGRLEEALSIHDSKYSNLPLIIEKLPSHVKVCHNCAFDLTPIVPLQVTFAPLILPDEDNDTGAEPTIEEELEPDELGWEDPANFAAAGAFA